MDSSKINDSVAATQGRTAGASGKSLGLRLYFHRDAISSASAEHRDLIARARLFSGIDDAEFNVIRVNLYASQVSFLHYPDFFDDPFPTLHKTIAVDLNKSHLNSRTYRESLNPPILHRKELLLPPTHPARPQFEALTASLDALGIFKTTEPIGFKRQWSELLADAGYYVDGHTLVPIANKSAAANTAFDNSTLYSDSSPIITRHLTALSRDRLSAPVRFLEKYGFLNGMYSLFDYGCGKGDDLKYLKEINVPSNGWDPYFLPTRSIDSF